jgi:hypothetical protein
MNKFLRGTSRDCLASDPEGGKSMEEAEDCGTRQGPRKKVMRITFVRHLLLRATNGRRLQS